MVLFRRILIRPGGVSGRKRAFPMDIMEYVFTEGTAADYDVMYDTVHPVPATPVSIAQSEHALATAHNSQRNLVRTSDGTLYVVYFKQLAGKYQIYVIKSEDDGATWTDDTRISIDDMAGYDQQYPCIVVDSSDNLHVIWQGKATGYTTADQLWYAKYTIDWSVPLRISTYADMEDYAQSVGMIAVDSNNHLHVVWWGRPTVAITAAQIWYRKYTTSWGAITRISTVAGMDSRDQAHACLAVDSNNYLHVVWRGKAVAPYNVQYQVWYRKYTMSWGAITRISTLAGMQNYPNYLPCISVDSNDYLHIVWIGRSPAHPVNFQIWYNVYTDSWAGPVRISDADNMASYSQLVPSIAVDSSDYLHVLWHGKATGFADEDKVWYALYVLAWATPVCIQPDGRNMYPNLRWSRWPR